MFDAYIAIVAPLFILVPVVVAICKYRWLSPAAKVIFAYLILSGIVNALAISLANHGINNMALLHLFTLLEFSMITFFYRIISLRTFYPYSIFLFASLCILNAVFLQPVYEHNTYSRSLEALLIIIMAVFLFYKLLNEATDSRWYKNSLVWFNMALLLYFSGSLFLFLFSKLLDYNRQANEIAWFMHATLVILMYLLFAIGFWQNNTTQIYNREIIHSGRD